MFSASSVRFLCALIVLLAVVHTGTCIECYVCSSANNADCRIVSAAKTPKLQCFEGQKACYKTVIGDVITRSCGLTPDCNSQVGCFSCTSNLCNSSSSIVPSFIITSILGLAIVKYFL